MEAARGRLSLWLFSYVALWLCSYVDMWLYGYVAMSLGFTIFRFEFTKITFSKICPYFLVFSEIFWYVKSINKGSPGLQSPEIMKMLGFGPSHNKTDILLDQNGSE